MGFEKSRGSHDAARGDDCRIEPFKVPDLKDCAALFGCSNHPVGFFKRASYRLFNKYGYRSLEQVAGDLAVRDSRDSEAHGVNLFEHLFIVEKKLRAVTLRYRLSVRFVDVCNSDQFGAVALGINSRVLATEVPRAYDSNFNHQCLSRLDPIYGAAYTEPSILNDKAEIIVERSSAAKHRPYRLPALLVFGIAIFSFGLGRLALIGPDEPRYAEVAREMFATGDWISPRLCGCLWFEKPALLYWMSATAYHLLGANEFAARLPSVVAAISAMLFLYHVSSRIATERFAFAASLAFVSGGLVIAYARVVTPDMSLAAAMSIALLAGYQATRCEGRARFGYWALSFASLGLAMLAKGLAGVALVVAIFAVYFALMRQPAFIRWRELLMGAAIFLVVAGTWYAPVVIKHGWPFIEEFFIRHHFRRYTSNTFGHPQPFYFFFVIALVGTVPWAFFLAPAVARLGKLKPRARAQDALLMFAWVWIGVPLLFFSFSESKLPGYILPIFPALAIVTGAEIERFSSGERSPLLNVAAWMTCLLLAAIAAGLPVYMVREQVSADGWRWIFFGLPLIIAAMALAALAIKRRRAFVICAALLVLSITVSATVLVLPKLSEALTLKTLSLQSAAALRPGERITFFIKKEFAPVFYAEGRVVCGEEGSDILNALSEDILAAALENESSLVVITTSNWRRGLESDPRFAVELIASQGDALAFRVSLKR